MKQAVLGLLRVSGANAAAAALTADRLRILCYHGLWTLPGFSYGNRLFMGADQFARRMQRLAESGRPVLPLGAAVERLEAGTLPAGAVVITIDDGWASTYTHMLPVLERLRLPATLYVASWYLGRDLPVVNKAVDYLHQRAGRGGAGVAADIDRIEALPEAGRAAALRALSESLGIPLDWWDARQFHYMTAHELRDAAARGLDIQLHTHRHRMDALARELADNRAALMAATGLPATHFQHFCYPSGEYLAAAEPALAAFGIRSATLVDQGTNGREEPRNQQQRIQDGR